MKIFSIIIFLLFISPLYTFGSDAAEFIELGKFSRQYIDLIINKSGKNSSGKNKIETISYNFIDVPYLGHTLIGSQDKKEILTINLGGVDCFTYIDYVEAIRNSSDFDSFKDNVRTIRYKDGVVDYSARNHFFSDWPIYNTANVKDISSIIGEDSSVTIKKQLNLKSDGTRYLPGIPVVERQITYIPTDKLTPGILDKINTGDYIGIYSGLDGLDVSHTGIVIKKEGTAYLRHASSRKKNKKVLDENLKLYLKNKPGIVIYRPL